LKISWSILRFPSDTSGCRAICGVDGALAVTVDGEVFGTLDDFLILEFAAEVEHWLRNADEGGGTPFYYRSMDEDEEPLLAFSGDASGRYVATSCWSSNEVRPLSHEELVRAFSAFLAELGAKLTREYGLDLADALSCFRPQARG
jgi:hypothetical protein